MVGLTTLDAHRGGRVPGIATSWTTSADGLTWTFKLRDALWSDGTPITADDFVFSWRRILDPKTAANYAYFLYVIRMPSPLMLEDAAFGPWRARARCSLRLRSRSNIPRPIC